VNQAQEPRSTSVLISEHIMRLATLTFLIFSTTILIFSATILAQQPDYERLKAEAESFTPSSRMRSRWSFTDRPRP